MKKYLLSLALISSTPVFAFPAYNIVHCNGHVNGHTIYVEYTKANHLLGLELDATGVAYGYANESGNRIYTDPGYDEYGNKLWAEILSSSSNWSAIFTIYKNDHAAGMINLSCQRVGLNVGAEQKSTSTTNILSTLSGGN